MVELEADNAAASSNRSASVVVVEGEAVVLDVDIANWDKLEANGLSFVVDCGGVRRDFVPVRY